MAVVSVLTGWKCDCGINRNTVNEVWNDCLCGLNVSEDKVSISNDLYWLKFWNRK